MFRRRFLRPVVFILSGVLLSFIPAYIYYGQSFLTSFVAYRVGFVYLTLPVFLRVRPSLKDVKSVLYAFSLLFFLLMICDSYLHIPIIAKDEEALLRIEQLAKKGDFEVNFLGGIQFVAMAFFFSLEESIRNLSIKKISLSLFFFLVILLYQNRSALFSCVLITLLLIVTLSNTKRNIKIKILILFLSIIVFVLSSDVWHNLLEETGEQVANSDYNRNLSYLYFIFEAPKGFLSYILGCGFLSASTTSLMQDMMELGVYNSDVGFVGMWNQFGLIPIVTITACCIRSLKRYRPLYLKSNALFILICSITISYFWEISTIVWFTLFLYLKSRNDYYETQKHILERR